MTATHVIVSEIVGGLGLAGTVFWWLRWRAADRRAAAERAGVFDGGRHRADLLKGATREIDQITRQRAVVAACRMKFAQTGREMDRTIMLAAMIQLERMVRAANSARASVRPAMLPDDETQEGIEP